MSPIQQMLLGAGGAVATKTYVDDVFSTFLYTGTGSAQTINNGIDLANEGGMVWFKSRTTGGSSYNNHSVVDTARVDSSGRGKSVYPNLDQAQYSPEGTANVVTSFNSNGYTTGTNANNATNTQTLASWTFRKSPGFFDVVTYTGTGSAQNISHSLGSVPGTIFIKGTSDAFDWAVYHRGVNGGTNPWDYRLRLNSNITQQATDLFGDTAPTASVFTVGTGEETNNNGETYVAYVFAGGESTAATARSVDFDGTGDYLSLGSSSDLAMGTGDFTIEGWYKINAKQNFGFFMNGPSGLSSTYGTVVWNYTGSSYGLQFITSGGYQATGFTPPSGQWFHLALVRNSGTTSLYYNGNLLKAAADTTNYTNTTFQIGGYDSSPYLMDGSVSNFRIVKGTAVYTSSFKPPTAPLTNITNTKLLCCNNSSTTGSTVTPGTITANGDPTASTDSPFDDPAGFVFGDAGDQNIIKCGSYDGSSSDVPVYTGGEAQWVMVKNISQDSGWYIIDVLRGAPVEGAGNCNFLLADSSAAENDLTQLIVPTAQGFIARSGAGYPVNHSSSSYVYIAIRRPDGYVGKPPELGSDAFNVTAADTTLPAFNANFAVDLAIYRRKSASGDWVTSTRLNGNKFLKTNSTDNESDLNISWFAYNDGFSGSDGFSTDRIGWLWKRHAGFDVVTYTGDGTARAVNHSLGREPEMMWVKRRNSSKAWGVYHKGLNGGSSPEDYRLKLNLATAEALDAVVWNSTAPTSTHFSVGNSTFSNNNNDTYIAMLFASVDGISKVGSYDGSSSTQTITTGFQPRFVILKSATTQHDCYVLDTSRGWGSGNDNFLALNDTYAQVSHDFGAPTSTGFTLTTDGTYNSSGQKYIYYAHA